MCFQAPSCQTTRLLLFTLASLNTFCIPAQTKSISDHVASLQATAIEDSRHEMGHWGLIPDQYTQWGNHSNRLIPVYTYGTRGAGPGIDLNGYTGESSVYRSETAIRRIYGRVPQATLNSAANYADQTNLAELQRAAIAAGRKYIFLVVFDGMDWQTSHAAATFRSNAVNFREGRGSGLHFLDYTAGGTSQFGSVVTSPHNTGTRADADEQTVENPGGTQRGGYDAGRGGDTPWSIAQQPAYLLGKSIGNGPSAHAYPDSAATATSLCSGIKTFNGAIGVDIHGEQIGTIAHEVQARNWSTGIVSSVPISHATPASAYAHNVTRNDYQDLSRDLLGLPSISHPRKALQGLDVVIGGGYGTTRKKDAAQGRNFIPGNRYLTAKDIRTIDVANGGKYHVAQRTNGASGSKLLAQTAARAAQTKGRILGFFGVGDYSGHLPYQTANGDYQPVADRDGESETYSPEDLLENPTLEQMTSAAIQVLSTNPRGFWLMVEAGDVDWANHSNNLDNSIGAVLSGDAAVRRITDWVESNSDWNESLLIITADHGHLLNVLKPELLTNSETAL